VGELRWKRIRGRWDIRNCRGDAAWSLTMTEMKRNLIRGHQDQVRVGRVRQEELAKSNAVVVGSRERLLNREAESVRKSPLRNVRLPVRAKLGPSLEKLVEVWWKLPGGADAHSVIQIAESAVTLVESMLKDWGPEGVAGEKGRNPLSEESGYFSLRLQEAEATITTSATADRH
jgi:hypothetical protein